MPGHIAFRSAEWLRGHSWRVSGQLPHSGRLSIYLLNPTRRGREPEASEPFVLPSWAIAPSGNYAVVDDRAHMPNVMEPTKLCIRDDPVWEFRSCHSFLLRLSKVDARPAVGVADLVAAAAGHGLVDRLLGWGRHRREKAWVPAERKNEAPHDRGRGTHTQTPHDCSNNSNPGANFPQLYRCHGRRRPWISRALLIWS